MLQAVRNLFGPVRAVNPVAEAWHQQYRRTPDLWYLSQHARQLLFVPDDFKVGYPKHQLLEGNEPIHPNVYTHRPYKVYNKDLGTHSFPLPFEEEVDFEIHGWYKPEPARVQGELYAIPTPFFWKVLDIQKDNGLQFTRKRVPITLPWREIKYSDREDAELWSKVPTMSGDCFITRPAWMYVASPEYWDNYIGVSLGTRAVPMFEHITPKHWIDRYYKF